jgi:adenylate cyclase
MFADLSGFTKLSETTDSQTLTDTINRYLSIIAKEVDESGGYVDKFIGDAVMAIWNAPAEREDHSLAAVEAALAIKRVVTEAAAKDRALGGVGFDIKIGINTGPATVGNVGSANRLSYSAIGVVSPN